MTETLELTVPELDCADEARQIEGTLGRLPGVTDVRTAVGARNEVVDHWPPWTQRFGAAASAHDAPNAIAAKSDSDIAKSRRAGGRNQLLNSSCE